MNYAILTVKVIKNSGQTPLLIARSFEVRLLERVKMKNLVMKTNFGEIKLELDDVNAPITTENFINYVKNEHYNDSIFHRVIPGFVIQGGCPLGTGTGGPGYQIPCEVDKPNQFHDRGVLSMAHAGRNTGGSQFFICHNRQNTQHLDKNHTCFGKVMEGVDIVDSIQAGDKIISISVI